ncbi:hypothetical protein EDC01DRAFT_614343 [Geopyxis carbonaria]|nr:hypothetical protein EDC01DRAFT_614343 [Geopyxis carbonaria]
MAECSTARNPLAQFTKHVSEDKSLQRDRQAAGLPMGAMGPEGIRTMGPEMNAADRQMMDNFYAQQMQPGQSPFAFEAMRNEIEQMQHSGQPMMAEGQPWASEFGPQSQMNPVEQANMEAAFASQRPGVGFDTAEFSRFQTNHSIQVDRMGTPALAQQQQPSAYHRQFQGYNIHGGMPFSAPAQRPYFPQPQQEDVKGKSKVVELSDENWEAQFKEMEVHHDHAEVIGEEGKVEEDKSMETMYGDFQAVWEGIQQEQNERANLETLDWANEFDSTQEWDPANSMTKSMPHMGEYLFEPDNPYMQHQDPFSEGKRLVDTGGNLSLAALAFEAAVQQNERHVDAWTELGACQAMNEKETPAIRAFEAALKIDEHLPALMGLSVSYTNEGYDTTAYATLERWLAAKYPEVRSQAGPPPASTIDRQNLHQRVTDMFIQAAMLSPDGEAMDADVQIGLGVLFYGDEEYDKAVDCFTAALQSASTSTSPEHLLWNRLGATLANSGRSEEAINAYERALTINPNFVRARYNLGVSCINIGCFQQAAEHLLGALAMHKVAEEKAREDARGIGVDADRIVQNQSTNLFDTLRRVFGQMGRRDLADMVVNGMELDVFRSVTTNSPPRQ